MQNTKKERACPYCDHNFRGPPSFQNKHKSGYCSIQCAIQHEEDIAIFEALEEMVSTKEGE